MYSVFICPLFIGKPKNDIYAPCNKVCVYVSCGGDKGIRTPDLYVANVSRYQLCYIPVLICFDIVTDFSDYCFAVNGVAGGMVGNIGFEPMTFSTSRRHSPSELIARKLLLPVATFATAYNHVDVTELHK